MMDAWLAFARNGSPSQGSLSSPSSPSSQSNWPPYDAERRATQVFGSECPLLEAPAERERLLWDEIRAARRSGA
jgi:carboxylesterase type B